jgi:hypothetical protein
MFVGEYMVLIGNDDGKKMVEREEAEQFLYEYIHVTGIEMDLVAIGERPDFACEKEGQRYGLELVKVMKNPEIRRIDALFGDAHLHGQDAAIMVQETVFAKEEKRSKPDWTFPDKTILVLQLVGSDGEELLEYLDDQLMEEISETGFCEIWIADDSTLGPYNNVQLIGIKPKKWRGLHRHSSYGKKEYDY